MMERLTIVIFTLSATSLLQSRTRAEETLLSPVLTPTALPSQLSRQSRSYYDYRYGRPFYERLEYDRGRCGRCYDDDDDDSDYQRDDDRRSRPRSKSKSRYDDDRRIDDRKSNSNNSTTEEDGDKSNDKPSGSRHRGRDRHRYDDRDRYRPDYYDRFLRDRHRDRDYDRYYDDYYRDRRPAYERYPDRYDYSGRYEYGYRRPYDDRYDDAFGGYGPGDGRGPHGSFRPWDETYRGLAGWDASGRGYYFASGRPDTAPAPAWGQQDHYTRPQYEGWQSGGYRDPLEYRGSVGYGQNNGYRQDYSYGQASGWQSVGERRPYRDESGVNKLYNKEPYNQRGTQSNGYGQSSHPSTNYGQTNNVQPNRYGQASIYGQTINYGQPETYGQSGTYGQNAYVQSSTTQETSYLFQREDQKENVNNKSTEKSTSKDS